MVPAGRTAENIDNVIINNRSRFSECHFFVVSFLSPFRHVPHVAQMSFTIVWKIVLWTNHFSLWFLLQLFCVYLIFFVSSHAVSFRPRRQTSQPESTGTVKDQNRIGGGNHPCEVQQHHPDMGRGAAGWEAADHVLQWQDREVTWSKLSSVVASTE